MEETEHETRKGEKAILLAKRKRGTTGEFFERLDFLVTFLAMKKVTKWLLVQRAQTANVFDIL